jgi:hypothetical protein
MSDIRPYPIRFHPYPQHWLQMTMLHTSITTPNDLCLRHTAGGKQEIIHFAEQS